ncbi:hypothetical protein HY496_00680 [Candidatus Woesearchaeota archaeon]|nr:hypothetical protein [Candidatus Woesearchaeota archaeon]
MDYATTLDLLVITNAVTDKLYHIPTAELERLGLAKGKEKRTKDPTVLAEKLASYPLLAEDPAGSPANVGFSSAALGLCVGLIGCLGTDAEARAYTEKISGHGIADHTQTLPGQSGVCYTFITEDGERTFLNLMNNAPKFDLQRAPGSARIIHTSCYEIVHNEEKFLDYFPKAKMAGAKISLDLASPETCRKIASLTNILLLTDFLFASPEEYAAATGKEFSSLAEHPFQHTALCVKYGAHGSRVLAGSSDWQIPALPTTVVNTNGAGDGYAAGFLTAYLQGRNFQDCGLNGSAVAAQVVGQRGASL